KTHKEETKKIISKYSRITNPAYLEAAYTATAKLYDRVPLVTRPGVETQIKEATSRKPGAKLRFEDMVDESIVLELEKKGFRDKDYRQWGLRVWSRDPFGLRGTPANGAQGRWLSATTCAARVRSRGSSYTSSVVHRRRISCAPR